MDKKLKVALKKHGFVYSIFAYPLLLFFIFYVGINFNSVLLAFQKSDIYGKTVFVGFDNFKEVFSNLKNPKDILSVSLINSLRMFIVTFVITFPLNIIFSYYIFKNYLGHKLFRLIVMIPAMVSSFIICLLFKKFVEEALPGIALSVFNKSDFPQLLSDPRYTYGTSIFYLIWISFSTALIVYPNAMNQISDSIIESSQLDGANPFQELWFIVLPLIYPTMSTFVVTSVSGIFINSGPLIAFYMYEAPSETWNFGYYMVSMVMKNGDASKSMLTYPYLSAAGLLLTLVSAPITFIVKHFLDKHDFTVEKKHG